MKGDEVHINDLKDFRFIWWSQLTTLRASADELRAAGYEVTPGPATRSKEKAITKRAAEPHVDTVQPRAKSAKTKKSTTPSSNTTAKVTCNGCGRPHHTQAACRFTTSLFLNFLKASLSAYAQLEELK